METIHTEILRGYKIEICIDHDPQNPRTEFDHLGKMLCAHSRYILGDDQFGSHPYMTAEQEITSMVYDEFFPDADVHEDQYHQAMLDKCPIIWLPLYLYDHSGITMNTTGFSCPWDSGQVGIIYVSLERAKTEWPKKMDETDEQWDHRIREYLKGEVEEYDNYLRGEVYGYRVYKPVEDEDGFMDEDDEDCWEEVESCWGFFGDYNTEGGCLEQARDAVPEDETNEETIVMVFTADGTVEFTRSPKLYEFFDGRGEMERISDIQKDLQHNGYYIRWLKGPNADRNHTYGMSIALGLLGAVYHSVESVIMFDTYEEAVEHEVRVLNAMRKQGVLFS